MNRFLSEKQTRRVAIVVMIQLGLVGFTVQDRLSARLTGDDYLLRVAPIDPMDPFRGAYVDLGYPDLQGLEPIQDLEQVDAEERVLPKGEVFVPLVRDGDVWKGKEVTAGRPGKGPFLKCDSDSWRLRCGIESYFVPQNKATAIEESVRSGTAMARVNIDGRGNAALIGLEIRP